MKKILFICIICLLISGCELLKNNQDVGIIAGGATGALVGSEFGNGSGTAVAVVSGVIIGALIGGIIGKSMDQSDQDKSMEAIRTNTTKDWHNENGNYYQIKPTKTYQSYRYQQNSQNEYSGKQNSSLCRDYQTTAIINGKKSILNGKACQQINGSWKNVSEET